MGDVADILGFKSTASSSSSSDLLSHAKQKKAQAGLIPKPKGMSREVFGLLGKDGLAPAIFPNGQGPAFKSKWVNSSKGKWIWAQVKPFSARSFIEEEKFFHWAKADIEYTDYPYSKFNTKIDIVTFTDEEYDNLLQSSNWSRSDTDHLMHLCMKYDLRWPIINDRYSLIPARTTEDMMERYYSIVTSIKSARSGASEGHSKQEAFTRFDIDYQKKRRSQQEFSFRKTKADEEEEIQLKEELRNIDTFLKNMKKSSKERAMLRPILGDDRNNTVIIPQSSAEQPTSGKPRLQSNRLVPLEFTVGLSRSLTKKMQLLLNELGMPEHPLPTQAVCDMVDIVRRDACVLLGLQTVLAKKEKELGTIKSHAKNRTDDNPVPSLVTTYSKDLVVPISMLTSSDYTPALMSPSSSLGPGFRKSSMLKRKNSATFDYTHVPPLSCSSLSSAAGISGQNVVGESSGANKKMKSEQVKK